MKIRFLFGYCGRETAMLTYNEGEVVEMNHDAALTLVNNGIAEEVTDNVFEPLPDFNADIPRVSKPKVKKVKYDTNA